MGWSTVYLGDLHVEPPLTALAALRLERVREAVRVAGGVEGFDVDAPAPHRGGLPWAPGRGGATLAWQPGGGADDPIGWTRWTCALLADGQLLDTVPRTLHGTVHCFEAPGSGVVGLLRIDVEDGRVDASTIDTPSPLPYDDALLGHLVAAFDLVGPGADADADAARDELLAFLGGASLHGSGGLGRFLTAVLPAFGDDEELTDALAAAVHGSTDEPAPTPVPPDRGAGPGHDAGPTVGRGWWRRLVG